MIKVFDELQKPFEVELAKVPLKDEYFVHQNVLYKVYMVLVDSGCTYLIRDVYNCQKNAELFRNLLEHLGLCDVG